MAFDYGSIDLGITNPFRTEGLIRAISGIPILLLGVLALLSVQALVADGTRETAALTGIVGGVLVMWSLLRMGAGLFQAFRFFVGRSVPANLAINREKSQADKADVTVVYTDQQLEQMLQGRQNISFAEPEDWFSRLVHSLFRRLLFLPYAYRNLAQRLARAITQTFIAGMSYALAWFSGTTGITDVTDTPVMDWLSLGILLYLLFVWWQSSPRLARLLREDRLSMPGVMTLTLWIIGAIMLPVALSFVHTEIVPLPEMPFSAGLQLLTLLLMGAVNAGLFVVLLTARSNLAQPVVEVAEYRDNWQESIHPQEIFINFENIVMANRRYREVPNRIYRGFEAKLFEQGSDDKGDFDGEMIQETQPVFHRMPVSQVLQLARTSATIIGAALFVLLAVLIYQLPLTLSAIWLAPESQSEAAVASFAVYGVIVGAFARLLQNFSHAFWAEMQFESLLVYFQCRGTYTASKLSTGTSIYDSTRSENVVVRSSMTPWVIATRAISSTFATSGRYNLELARYILEMHKAEEDLTAIMDDLQQFMRRREAIASINNEQDLAAASRIFQVNQQTRAQLDAPTGAHPPVDAERISEASGADDDTLPK